VDRVFVDHPLFLAKVWGKTGSKLYGKTNGSDFADNQERFAMFCKAALEAPLVLPFGYGEDVCFVSNDWHSGLVPVLLNKVYRPSGASSGCARAPQWRPNTPHPTPRIQPRLKTPLFRHPSGNLRKPPETSGNLQRPPDKLQTTVS
jgi:hypothetical protein